MAADNSLITALKVADVQFTLLQRQEMSRQTGGVTRGADMGDPLWRAEITSSQVGLNDFSQMEALVEILDGVVGTFLCWNPSRQYPKTDPTGSILGASSVQINSVGGDNKSLSLKGLPVGFILTRGDMLSFVYNTTVIAMHRIVAASATANGSGVTPVFEVRPHIRPTAPAVSTAVVLKRPYCEMMIEPGSYDPRASRNVGRMSFSAVQIIA